MDGNTVIGLGYPEGSLVGAALRYTNVYKPSYVEADQMEYFDRDMSAALSAILGNSSKYVNNPTAAGELARNIEEYYGAREVPVEEVLEEVAKPYKVFNSLVEIQPEAVAQMDMAMRVGPAVKGAILPDGHLGYGLPIGGVWGMVNAVSPNAVGSDIACQVNITVFEESGEDITVDDQIDMLYQGTRFKYDNFRRDASDHPLFHSPLWKDLPYFASNPNVKEKAIQQFGSSGDGNHFANFGIVVGGEDAYDHTDPDFPMRHFALVTHWGSRTLGARIAKHYQAVAEDARRHLPKEAKPFAWLYADEDDGVEYINAMQLASWYASAGHAFVHNLIGGMMGLTPKLTIQSIHNIATFENHLWVHRKGATPAAEGQYGIIPGSMAEPTYLVTGKGNPDSLESASHGAGRAYSRSRAKRELSQDQMDRFLKKSGVTLIGGALDESPMAYKNIEDVMDSQLDCVTPFARFLPKVVRMAP